MGRTDAIKKGDLFDGILEQNKIYEEYKDIPEQVYDYPEIVINTLKSFCKIWKLPFGAVPTKRMKKKYNQWVEELIILNSFCNNSNDMEEAMKLSLNLYNNLNKKFIISHPLSIKNLLISSVGEINRYKKLKKENLNIPNNKLVSLARNLKKEINKEA